MGQKSADGPVGENREEVCGALSVLHRQCGKASTAGSGRLPHTAGVEREILFVEIDTQSDEQHELLAKNIEYRLRVDTSLYSAAECADTIIKKLFSILKFPFVAQKIAAIKPQNPLTLCNRKAESIIVGLRTLRKLRKKNGSTPENKRKNSITVMASPYNGINEST